MKNRLQPAECISDFDINNFEDLLMLKGVGPKRSKILNSVGINSIQDLLRNFPRKYLDRTNIKYISDLIIGDRVVIVAKVKSFTAKKVNK